MNNKKIRLNKILRAPSMISFLVLFGLHLNSWGIYRQKRSATKNLADAYQEDLRNMEKPSVTTQCLQPLDGRSVNNKRTYTMQVTNQGQQNIFCHGMDALVRIVCKEETVYCTDNNKNGREYRDVVVEPGQSVAIQMNCGDCDASYSTQQFQVKNMISCSIGDYIYFDSPVYDCVVRPK